MKIEREIPVPLYYRLAEIVKEKILDAEFEIGDLIPTEAELKKEYGVSRITVRQAIDLLCKQGFLARERGKTPYVVQSKLEHTFGPISSFTKNIRAKGFVPGTKVLSLCYTKPPGIVHFPFPGSPFLFSSRTLPSHTITAPTPTIGRSG